jgi:hypothetical protein
MCHSREKEKKSKFNMKTIPNIKLKEKINENGGKAQGQREKGSDFRKSLRREKLREKSEIKLLYLNHGKDRRQRIMNLDRTPFFGPLLQQSLRGIANGNKRCPGINTNARDVMERRDSAHAHQADANKHASLGMELTTSLERLSLTLALVY